MKNRSRRLRKKLRVGEFTDYSFTGVLVNETSDLDEIQNRFVDIVESQGCQCMITSSPSQHTSKFVVWSMKENTLVHINQVANLIIDEFSAELSEITEG